MKHTVQLPKSPMLWQEKEAGLQSRANYSNEFLKLPDFMSAAKFCFSCCGISALLLHRATEINLSNICIGIGAAAWFLWSCQLEEKLNILEQCSFAAAMNVSWDRLDEPLAAQHSQVNVVGGLADRRESSHWFLDCALQTAVTNRRHQRIVTSTAKRLQLSSWR